MRGEGTKRPTNHSATGRAPGSDDPVASPEARLLQAAQDLWRSGGFAAVTTRAVAARAQVNEVTLFRHFGSKDGLVRAMVAKAIPMLHPAPAGPGRADTPLELKDDLESWARTYLSETLPKADMLLLGLMEAREHPDLAPVLRSVPETLRQRLARHLEERTGTEDRPPGLCADVAHAFYATLFAEVLAAHLDDHAASEAVATSGPEPGGVGEAGLTEPRRAVGIDAIARRTAYVYARALSGGTLA